MRRFSQRSSLVTLSEINITPLLDLAFVLLIIFVITTPLLDQGFNLKLSPGGNPDQQPVTKNDIKTVEISQRGEYMLDRSQMSLDQVESVLVMNHRANPNLVVYIRADKNGRVENMMAVIERCQRNGITRYSLRTEPPKPR